MWTCEFTGINMNISGQCHCGAISFTAVVDPNKVVACHCADCQQFSGAPFRAVLPTPIDKVALTGQPKTYVKLAASGNCRVQAFCEVCGTQIYSTEPDSPAVLSLRLGCVNERALLPPVIQIWGQSAMPWLKSLPEVSCHVEGLTSPLANYPTR